jgi:stage II sporulation protein D
MAANPEGHPETAVAGASADAGAPAPARRPARDGDQPALGRRRVLLAAGQAVTLLAAGGCCRLIDEEPPPADDGNAADAGVTDDRSPEPGPLAARHRPPTREPLVRVRIGTASPDEPVRLGAAGATLAIQFTPAPDGERAPEAARGSRRVSGLRAPVELRRRGTSWRWRDADDRTGTTDEQTPSIDIIPAGDGDPGRPATIAWSGARWPGRLRLLADGDRIDLVNLVPMETYIPGVLARELFARWSPATFAAQAIAARSFATVQLLDRRRRDWDVEADQRSQMFAGVTDLPVAVAAAEATAGVLLTYAGAVLPAYYSSTCGGIGMPARLAIGPDPANAVPPLEGHALGDCCRDAPRFAWSAARSLDRVRQQLQTFGRREDIPPLRTLGPIRHIGVHQRTAAGRPTEFRIEHGDGDGNGDDDHIRISGPRLRRALQSNRRDGEDPVWSAFLEPTVVAKGGRVVFGGRGWGHGAGLCQYGAESLARAGRTIDEILAAYFPGAARTSAWTPRVS